MDLWDLTKLLYRRWYVAVPLLILSMAVVALVAQGIKPDYSAKGHLQLIPAPGPTKPDDPKASKRPNNPWLDLDYEALGNAAMLAVIDQRRLAQFADNGLTDQVTVVLDETTVSFQIEAIGTSPKQATDTVREVIRGLQEEVAAKQKQYGALPEDTITTLVLDDGGNTKVVTSKVTRVLIVAGGLGVLITVAATIGLDTWLRRRNRRRLEAANGDPFLARVRPDTPPPNPAREAAHANGVYRAAEAIDEYQLHTRSDVDPDEDIDVDQHVDKVDETIILPIVGTSWSTGANKKR